MQPKKFEGASRWLDFQRWRAEQEEEGYIIEVRQYYILKDNEEGILFVSYHYEKVASQRPQISLVAQ